MTLINLMHDSNQHINGLYLYLQSKLFNAHCFILIQAYAFHFKINQRWEILPMDLFPYLPKS